MSSASQLPPASTRRHNFEQAVAYALHLWPALTLSVSNGWGGPESAEKRDWFAGAIVDLFPEFTDAVVPAATAAATSAAAAVDEPDTEDVETVLLQVMVDEFEVNVDDDSALEVAEQIVRARAQCAVGQFDETYALAERFGKLRGAAGGSAAVGQMFKRAEDPDQDTDGDESGCDDDDDGDVDMGEAPGPSAPREKPAPEVDEDGFTKVTGRRR